MAEINVKVAMEGGLNAPGQTPQQPAGTGRPEPGKPNKESPADAALEREKRLEAAARREIIKRMGKATDEQVRSVRAGVAELAQFDRRIRKFGGDLEKLVQGYSKTFVSPSLGAQHHRDLMRRLGLPEQGMQQAGGIMGMLGTAARGMIRATGIGGGVAGGIMNSSIQQAQDMDGGAASAGGISMLAKGAGVAALAYAGIKVIQKVGEKVGQAQDEAIGYSDLRRALGGNVEAMETLQGSVNKSVLNLGVLTSDALALAKNYSTSSQVYGKASGEVGQAVGIGVGLSRGMGIDPASGVSFLGGMRHFGASDGTDKDNRRLALLIGDAVGKTRAFSKADDVLQAISYYVETSTRQTFNRANTEGYAGFLGALGSLKLPGLDAAGSANIMGKVAAGWNGGGEAGQNLRLGWLQKHGVTALEMGAIDDAGPWALPSKAFDENSSYYKAAEAGLKGAKTNEDKAKYRAEMERAKQISASMSAGGQEKTALVQELEYIKQQQPNMLRQSIMGKLNLSWSEAGVIKSALDSGDLGSLDKKVEAALGKNRNGFVGAGKSMSEIDPNKFSELAMIQFGDEKSLKAMRDKDLNRGDATATEKSALVGAKDTDALREVLTQFEAFRDTSDKGEEARKAAVNLDNQFKAYAASIIPLTNAIQQGVFALLPSWVKTNELKQIEADVGFQRKIDAAAGDQGKIKAITDEAVAIARKGQMSSEEEQDRRHAVTHLFGSAAERGEKIKAITEERDRRNAIIPSQIQSLVSRIDENAATMASSHGVAPNQRDIKARKGMQLTAEELAYLAETDKLLGAKPGTSAAQIQVESGNNPDAISKTGAWGLGQIMPRERAIMEQRMGRKIKTRKDQLEAHRLMMLENKKKYKTVEDSLRAYNGGWSPDTWWNRETSEYVGKVAAARGDTDAQVPAAARPANAAIVASGSVDMSLTLNGPSITPTEVQKRIPLGFKGSLAGLPA
jgi:hypothetical protein